MNQTKSPFDPGKAVSVMFGTTLESVTDMVTFGVAKPDIIPEIEEAQHPWATTVGNIIGGIAGFAAPGIGSIRTANIAWKSGSSAFKAFRFSTQIADKAEAATKLVKGGETAAYVLKGYGNLAATFAIHDAARELVSGVKEGQPDLWETVSAGLRGSFVGTFTGLTGTAVYNSNPLTQAIAHGVTMTAAEMIADTAGGVNTLSKDYIEKIVPQTFLSGVMIGLYNSRGYKGRQLAAEEMKIAAGFKLLKSFDIVKSQAKDSPGSEWEIVETREVVTGRETIIDLLAKINPRVKREELSEQLRAALKATEPFMKIKQQGGFSKNRTWTITQVGEKTNVPDASRELHQVMAALGLKEETYRAFLKMHIGKESTKEFSGEDYDKMFTKLDDYLKAEMTMAVGGFGLKGEQRTPHFLESYFSPADRLFRLTGLADLYAAQDLKLARDLMDAEAVTINEIGRAMESRWNRLFNEGNPGMAESIVGKGQNVFFNRPGVAKQELSRYLQFDPSKPISETNKPYTAIITPEMKAVADQYRDITKFYWQRTNQILKLMGRDEIPYQDYYMRRTLDYAAMRKAGLGEYIPKTEHWEIQQDKRLSAFRKEGTQYERIPEEFQKNYRYNEDPFFALRNMAKADLKAIYLQYPNKILVEELDALQHAGIIDAEYRAWADNFFKLVIFNRQTKGTQAVDKFLSEKVLRGNFIGKTVEKMVNGMGRDIGESPLEAFASLWGKGVSGAYIGARPKLALRNLTQIFFPHAFIEGMSLARGITWAMGDKKNTPGMVKKYMETSQFHKTSIGKAEEDIGSTTVFDKMMHGTYTKAHVHVINASILGAYDQSMKYILHPKNKHGWATKEGIALRAKAKTAKDPKWNEIVSAEEERYIFNEMDAVANHSEFLYTSFGMPMLYRSKLLNPLFKLMSFPMNYVYKFGGELRARALTGRPGWAKDNPNIKLPVWNQYGFLKHFVLTGLVVASLDKMGFDYSSLVSAGYLPTEDRPQRKKDQNRIAYELSNPRIIHPFSGDKGILNMQPSPGMTAIMAARDMWSDDPYTAKRGLNEIIAQVNLVPGRLALRDVTQSIQPHKRNTGIRNYLFYSKPEPKRKKVRLKQLAFRNIYE